MLLVTMKTHATTRAARSLRLRPSPAVVVAVVAAAVACFALGAAGQEVRSSSTSGGSGRAQQQRQELSAVNTRAPEAEGRAPSGADAVLRSVARPGGGAPERGRGGLGRAAAALGNAGAGAGPDAPRLTVEGSLRLCGGGQLPETLRTNQRVCIEQRLTGVTRQQVRRRSLEATGVNVTFAGERVDPRFVSEPSLFVHPPPPGRSQPQPQPQRGGVFGWGGNNNAAASAAAASGGGNDPSPVSTASAPAGAPAPAADADADVYVRFNLTVAGLPLSTSGALETSVSVGSTGRYYYEIVWYELELTVPTYYAGAEYVTIREGEKLGLEPEEIEENLDDLVEGSAVFFPCTNFIVGPFCEERDISV